MAFVPQRSKEGELYLISESQKADFHEKGLAILENFLTEGELKTIESTYEDYMKNGSSAKQGKDFCDMSQPFNTPREDYQIVNAMLPRVYYPVLQNNVFERLAKCVVKQIYPDVEMDIDYDQLLDKTPKSKDAIFAWHQDMAYWPPASLTPDTRTVTFSLALDSTTKRNGCIKYIPGSGKAKTLRSHKPIGTSREEAHAIQISVDEEAENVEYAQVKRGSVSIHDEYVVHGSGGNYSDGRRRTYVIAFRSKDTIRKERDVGFTHSHNDTTNWDVFNQWK